MNIDLMINTMLPEPSWTAYQSEVTPWVTRASYRISGALTRRFLVLGWKPWCGERAGSAVAI